MLSSGESVSECSLPAEKTKTRRGREVFSKDECDALLNIISKHPSHHVLSRTNQSQAAREEVRKTWEFIREAFMASGKATKDWSVAQLKVWYKNKRARAKDEKAEFKRQQKQTGGGPPPKPLPAETEKMASILGDDMKSLDNPHDCDAEYNEGKDVIDPDSYGIRENTSAGRLKEDSTLRRPTTAFNKKTRRLVKKDEENGLSFREKEHELFMKKMSLEIEVLQLKKNVLHLQTEVLTLQAKKLSQESYQFNPSYTYPNASSITSDTITPLY